MPNCEDLPKKYSLPTGRAFIACEDGKALRLWRYRWRGDAVVEMKRLFVLPQFAGKGYGRKLCTR